MTFFLLCNKHNTTLYARDVSKATAFLNRLVHLMKKTVAPEALWLCSAALCFLDGEKNPFFLLVMCCKLRHCQEIPWCNINKIFFES
jgi:hypothetical protein